jgi:hypothetical protein
MFVISFDDERSCVNLGEVSRYLAECCGVYVMRGVVHAFHVYPPFCA